MSIWTNCYTCHKALIVGTPCPNCEAPQLSPSAPLRERCDTTLSRWLMSTSDELTITRGDRTELLDALVAFVQSERQQAAEQMREECAKACDAERVRYATVMQLENHAHAAKVCARSVRALPLTGGAK